jgi:hypothetical protein
LKISADVRLVSAMVIGLVSYIVIQHSDPSTMAFGLSSYLASGHTDPSTKAVVARYVEELKAIEAVAEQSDQPQESASRLARVKSNVETVETIARGIEQALATKSAGCEFAKAAGDAIEKAIPAAIAATNNVLNRLRLESEQRYHGLTEQNEALGWVGWRGSREQEIQELILLGHEISITSHNSDLAFDRLQIKASALKAVVSTCGIPGTPTENRVALPTS